MAVHENSRASPPMEEECSNENRSRNNRTETVETEGGKNGPRVEIRGNYHFDVFLMVFANIAKLTKEIN